MKRILHIFAFILLTAVSLTLAFIFNNRNTEVDQGPLFFHKNSERVIYTLDSDLNVIRAGIKKMGVYFDGRIYIFKDSRRDFNKTGYQSIYSVLPDGSDEREEFRIDLIYSDDIAGRPEVTFDADRHRLYVDDDYMFFYLLDTKIGHFTLCRLDRKTGELKVYEDIEFLYNYDGYQDGYVYFVDRNNSVCKLDPNTGNIEIIYDEQKVYRILYIDNNRIYLMSWAGSSPDNTLNKFSINTDGSKPRNENHLRNGIFNNGWMYYFEPDVCSHLTDTGESENRTLYRTNIRTRKTQELISMYYCANYFPSMFFGNNGMVVREDSVSIQNYWYIPFNSGEPTLLTLKP